jgi:hypothetical protein
MSIIRHVQPHGPRLETDSHQIPKSPIHLPNSVDTRLSRFPVRDDDGLPAVIRPGQGSKTDRVRIYSSSVGKAGAGSWIQPFSRAFPLTLTIERCICYPAFERSDVIDDVSGTAAAGSAGSRTRMPQQASFRHRPSFCLGASKRVGVVALETQRVLQRRILIHRSGTLIKTYMYEFKCRRCFHFKRPPCEAFSIVEPPSHI